MLQIWAENLCHAMRAGRVPNEGTRRTRPVRLKPGFAGDEFGYCVTMGLPAPGNSAFALDPELKREPQSGHFGDGLSNCATS